MYVKFYQIIKNRRPGPYNSLRHADNKTFFGFLSNTESKRSAHVSFGEGSGKNLCKNIKKVRALLKIGETLRFSSLHCHFRLLFRKNVWRPGTYESHSRSKIFELLIF